MRWVPYYISLIDMAHPADTSPRSSAIFRLPDKERLKKGCKGGGERVSILKNIERGGEGVLSACTSSHRSRHQLVRDRASHVGVGDDHHGRPPDKHLEHRSMQL